MSPHVSKQMDLPEFFFNVLRYRDPEFVVKYRLVIREHLDSIENTASISDDDIDVAMDIELRLAEASIAPRAVCNSLAGVPSHNTQPKLPSSPSECSRGI